MSINKVYIVADGINKIKGIFTDKEKAEEYVRCANFVPRGIFNNCYVKEYEFNPDPPDIPTATFAKVRLNLGKAVDIQDIKLKRSFIEFSEYSFAAKYDNPYRVIYGTPYLDYRFMIDHPIPIYPNDTRESICERGYEVLCDNLEKWKAWRLKKEHGEDEK